jgi:hypothetical protein
MALVVEVSTSSSKKNRLNTNEDLEIAKIQADTFSKPQVFAQISRSSETETSTLLLSSVFTFLQQDTWIQNKTNFKRHERGRIGIAYQWLT